MYAGHSAWLLVPTAITNCQMSPFQKTATTPCLFAPIAGEGAFATVEQCQYTPASGGPSRMVAVKKLKPEAGAQKIDLDCFMAEVGSGHRVQSSGMRGKGWRGSIRGVREAGAGSRLQGADRTLYRVPEQVQVSTAQRFERGRPGSPQL